MYSGLYTLSRKLRAPLGDKWKNDGTQFAPCSVFSLWQLSRPFLHTSLEAGMADIITRVIASPPSLGHVSSLTKERSRQGKGAFTKDPPEKEKNSLLSTKASAPRKERGKGNVLDIRV